MQYTNIISEKPGLLCDKIIGTGRGIGIRAYEYEILLH